LAGPVPNPGVFRVSALVWVFGIAALLLVPAGSLALTKTMNVVTTMPERDYRAGDWVTLTTHVLNFGIHENASTIDVYLNRGRVNERVLEVRPIDQGVYESTFQILASDAVQRIVRVMVAASIGDLDDFALLSFLVESLAVEVSATPSRATPGSSVDVVVRVLDGGQARDADSLSVWASVVNVGGELESSDLPWFRLDVGTYLVAYGIPETIEQDTIVSFLALVAAGSTASGSGLLFVDVPTTLVVWSHGRSVESSGAVLDILVANETGWPVSGAAVSLRYAYYDSIPYFWRRDLSGTTDDRGVAFFNLSYPDAQGGVAFWGTVWAGSMEQGFEGALTLPAPVSTRWLDIRRDSQLDEFASGEMATLHYSVLHDGTALPSQTIYFYAHTREDFVASGAVTTDSSGRFDIGFAIPSGSTTIEFASRVGAVWIYSDDVVFAARPLPLTVGPLFVGSLTHLSAPVPSDAGPYLGFIMLLPYRLARGSLEFPWGLANGALGIYDVAVSEGGTIEHDLVVPRFLPKGEEYLLYVFASPLIPASADETYVYADTFLIENLPPTAASAVSSLRINSGTAVEIDASTSFDRDGAIEAYEIDWGDGTSSGWTPSARASHAFARAGEYRVTIRVRDDSGAVSDLTVEVLVGASAATSPPPEQLGVAAALASAASAAVVVVLRHLLRPASAQPRSKVSRGADPPAAEPREAHDPPPLPPPPG